MWFKVDDNILAHPKFLSIRRDQRIAAIGLWCALGSWCGRNENDGVIPEFMVDEVGGNPQLAEILVLAGLWELREDGYAFHDWDDCQPTKEDLLEKRRKHREAQSRYARHAGRNKKDGTSPISRRSLIDQGSIIDDQQDITDNPPTRPDPITEGDKSPSGGTRKRAARLPENWILSQEQGDWAVAKGLPAGRVIPESEKFKDYWLAKSGREATKLDWDRTWHNWVRTAIERGPGTPGTPSVRQAAVTPAAPRYPKVQVEPDWNPPTAPAKTREEIEAEMARLAGRPR